MDAKELRKQYLEFFKSKGHAIIPSASIIPENDPTTLFTSSGMQPLVPYLMGEPHPAGKRLADIQKSFRLGDIDEVGDNRHTTCFEMLGNWSLGDYFKEEQLEWYFEFLSDVMKFDPERLYVSVYSGNQEIGVERDSRSVAIWKKIFTKHNIEAKDIDKAETGGLQGGRIFYYGDDKNWWSRSGPPGNMPIGEIGGPDSEVFFDQGAALEKHEHSQWKDRPCHINCDCGRFIEIGNSVFIEFIRTDKGFEPLPQQNVDFGGGLERTAMVSQGLDNIFETDLYANSIARISRLAGGKAYRSHMKPFEVIADHIKGATFIMGDHAGITPSNVDQGYIVRRLIRRALRYGRQLGITDPSWTKEIAKVVVHDYGPDYPELKENIDAIVANFDEEEAKFSHTLDNGLKQFSKIAETKKVKSTITAVEAFDLYQTYGFPLEMTVELASEKGLEVDENGFKKEFEKHQELSRTAAAGKFKGGLADAGVESRKYHTATHLLNAALRKVLGEHVYQKGSNITGERLRFDFSHPDKLTPEEKAEVEKIVNDVITADLPVSWVEMSVEDAKAKNALGVFEAKYGDKVKVYTVGSDDKVFSREICGGPHVEHTGELGHFRIKKEESSSAGVRRIKAVLE